MAVGEVFCSECQGAAVVSVSVWVSFAGGCAENFFISLYLNVFYFVLFCFILFFFGFIWGARG